MVVASCGIDYMRANGAEVVSTTRGSMQRKTAEGTGRSAPVYFGGADNEEPAAEDVVDPPPCGYDLTGEQAGELTDALALHGIDGSAEGDGLRVLTNQPAEPVIPLPLDARGQRAAVEAQPPDEATCAALGLAAPPGEEVPEVPAAAVLPLAAIACAGLVLLAQGRRTAS